MAATESAHLPLIQSQADIGAAAGKQAYVIGTYEQEDVRMMQVNPATLYQGHAVIVLKDQCRVFLYPPAKTQAKRSKQEIERFEHKKVKVLGTILPTIPQEGAVQKSPCLIDIKTIEPA